jgi:hypothetical protein
MQKISTKVPLHFSGTDSSYEVEEDFITIVVGQLYINFDKKKLEKCDQKNII